MKRFLQGIVRLSIGASALFSLFGPMSKAAVPESGPLVAGDHWRAINVDNLKRTYVVHVPKGYNPKQATPVVLALHGAAMSGWMMVGFTGLNVTSEKDNFIVVYPDGSGIGTFRIWNAGGFSGKIADGMPDDVKFLGAVLDDVGTVTNVDAKRVYACGMSNGGMMCYRLAAELSDRIAAIAPVAGAVAVSDSNPKRPVPVLHFHGTSDGLVPYKKRVVPNKSGWTFMSAEESIATWVKLDGCDETPVTDVLSKDGDELKVTRQVHGNGKDGAEVILVTVEGGGHTWPGQKPPVNFIGKSALNVCADDLIWEFFKAHPMK